MNETKLFVGATFLIAVLAVLFPSLSTPSRVGGAYLEASQHFPVAEDSPVVIPELAEGVVEPELSARAVIVKDINSDLLLLEKNREAVLPIASLTKLLTAIVVNDRLVPEEVIEVKPSDVEVVPFVADLFPGQEVLAKDLLAAMLVASANDAALVLARGVTGDTQRFVELMNKEAQRLGMSSSSFTNPVGFDNPNHYSTATDLTVLVDEFLSHPDLRELVSRKETSFTPLNSTREKTLTSTNKLLGTDPRIVGVKTGYTTESRGSMIVLVEDPDHPYYVVVLGSQNRESETQQIIRWVEESFEWKS